MISRIIQQELPKFFCSPKFFWSLGAKEPPLFPCLFLSVLQTISVYSAVFTTQCLSCIDSLSTRSNMSGGKLTTQYSVLCCLYYKLYTAIIWNTVHAFFIKVVIDRLSFIVYCLSLIYCLLLIVHCSLFIAYCLLFCHVCLLFIVNHLLFIVNSLSFIIFISVLLLIKYCGLSLFSGFFQLSI